MSDLKKALNDFTEAAMALGRVIEENNAEMLIADDYPFEKSYDELLLKIIDWRDTASREWDLSRLEANDFVDIAVFDSFHGCATVIKNCPRDEKITIKWFNGPSPCYPGQTYTGEDEIALSYSEIAYLKIFWSEEQVRESLEDSGYTYDKAHEDEIVRLVIKEANSASENVDIETAITRVMAQNDYGLDSLDLRLNKNFVVY